MSKFNIVQFRAASGLPLTGDFIVTRWALRPMRTVKRAMFWNRDKYGLILGRLQNHINGKGAVDPTTFDLAPEEGCRRPVRGSPEACGPRPRRPRTTTCSVIR